MKTAESKSVATATKSTSAFFTKQSGQDFFGTESAKESFFSGPVNSVSPIQAKLNIGAANDKYEREADSMADKVVQKLGFPERQNNCQPLIQSKQRRINSVPSLQEKCAECEAEEKLQKKENNGEEPEKLQRQQNIDGVRNGVGDNQVVQQKCETCEEEEKKLQEKKNEEQNKAEKSVELQKKSDQQLTPEVSENDNPRKNGNGILDFNKANLKKASGYSAQAKLTIGQPNDKYEKEADAVADATVQKLSEPSQVTSTDSQTVSPFVQAKCASCEEEERKEKQEGPVDEVPEIHKMTDLGFPPDIPPANNSGNGEDQNNGTAIQRNIAGTGIHGGCPECEESEKVFNESEAIIQREPESAPRSDGSRESIVAFAKSQIGKVEAKHSDGSGKRVGSDRLLEYFNVAAPGVWPDSVIETAGANMPAWCGIFSVWAHKKAGKDIGTWQMGRGVSAFNTISETTSPQPGDIGYINKHQHHCIVMKLDGDTIYSIDGNSGLYGEVTENKRSFKDFAGFFTAFGGGTSVQRKEDEDIQANSGANANNSSSSLERNLNTSKGSGSALPEKARTNMESSMGFDFSNVRIHTDSSAVQMNKDLHAQAFTYGSDIYFNAGKYDTASKSGEHLLAHELTHTIQQGASVHRKPTPDIQRAPSRSDEEAIDAVYDALDGYTSSDDSFIIWNNFDSKSKTSTDAILKGVASKAGDTVPEVIEWMQSDMVTSDWKKLLGHFILVEADLVEKAIAVEVADLLGGYTSDDDSHDILALFVGASPVGGNLLTKVLSQLESETDNGRNDMVIYLFGDMTLLDAHRLSLHFFNSGSTYGVEYASYWIAYKVYDLLSGYTSSGDSSDIVKNFERVPPELRSYVLYELEKITQEEWDETAAESMMDDMDQGDYNELRRMMPQLPVYNPQKSWLEWAWDKVTDFFAFIEGLLEYVVCGIVGAILGILSVVKDIVVMVVDIVVAIKDLIGMVIYYVSGGRICRENKERVFEFFHGIGEFFSAPGEAISAMWNEITLEASLIEGPFKECKQAIFWMTKVANLIVNIILIFAAGYGAVKLALEGIEGLVALIRAGELLTAIKNIPGKLLQAVKGLPGAAAKSVTGTVGKVIGLFKNPVKIISTARNTISTIRLAIENEGFFNYLRKEAGEIVTKESKFWKERKEFWKKGADEVDGNIADAEGKLVGAANSAVEDPVKAESLVGDAEKSATTAEEKGNDLLDDVKTGTSGATDALEPKLPETWRKGQPGRPPMLDPAVAKMRALGISDDKIIAIIKNAALSKDYDPSLFIGDLNRFAKRFEKFVSREGFDSIVRGLATEKNFVTARMLMTQVSNGQDISAIMKVLNLEDIATLKPRFPGADKDFITDLNKIVSRIKGNRDDIFALLNEAGDPTKLNEALDRLGNESYLPAQVRESLAFGEKLAKAIEGGVDEVAKVIWGDAIEVDAEGKVVRNADGKIKFTSKLSKDKAGDLVSSYIRTRTKQIAELILNGEKGTEVDPIKWGVVKDALLKTDLPTIVQNDILGEVWAFTKVKQYENLGFEVIREVSFKVLGADGTPTGVEARLDAVLKKGDEIFYKEFKSTAAAETSTGQDEVYGLMEKGAKEKLKPYGANAEKAFGGKDMPGFKPKKVDIERP
jgi:hypothetical protein